MTIENVANIEKKLPFIPTLTEIFKLTLTNVFPVIGAVLLWILTIWIPYLNIGTTIAINTLPLALSKGEMVNPLFIFDGKYRRYMGEYFVLLGLRNMGMMAATCFFVFPGLVVFFAWSLSTYLMLDKNISPSDALMKSNQLTYGHKWKYFFLILTTIPLWLLSAIPIAGLIFVPISWTWLLCVDAVVYRKLSV